MTAERRSPAARIHQITPSTETGTAQSTPTSPSASPAPFRRSKGRVAYPHRVSLDLDPDQYQWLRTAAWEAHSSGSDIIRALITLTQADEQLHSRLLENARTEPPTP